MSANNGDKNIVFIVLSPNVSVHRRRLVRRTVERLVGLFIWFSAVLLWPIVLNVTVWSLFFALSMWKVQCTCGSLLFICPTSAFTGGALCAVRWNALLDPIFSFFCPEGKGGGKFGRKIAKIGPLGPFKVIMGRFFIIFPSWRRREGIFASYFLKIGCRGRSRAVA